MEAGYQTQQKLARLKFGRVGKIVTTKPNYEDLLAQIAIETDPNEKQRLINLCYQFTFDDITEEDIELFSYVEDEYVIPNPGYQPYGPETASEFAAYVGLYYSDEGETT